MIQMKCSTKKFVEIAINLLIKLTSLLGVLLFLKLCVIVVRCSIRCVSRYPRTRDVLDDSLVINVSGKVSTLSDEPSAETFEVLCC